MKHRTITYTNKPRSASPKENHWMLIVFLAIIVLLLFNNFSLKAEGTKSIAPSTEDEAALFIGAGNTGSTGGDYGQFAWKGSNSKLSFNIQNTCEKAYFGFSIPKKDRTLSLRNLITGGDAFERKIIFRILDPRGVPINDMSCFGNRTIDGEVWQTLQPEDINLSSREQTDIGPKQLNDGGYEAFELDLSACGLTLTGDYSIEFYIRGEDYDPNTTSAGFYIEYFDVTVADCSNQALTGRLWSNNWGLAIKRDGDGPFDRAFNGAFYICSKEGFITKIDFNTNTNNRTEIDKNNDQRSGFRAGSFNVSFNTSGPKNTGNIQADRKSVFGANESNAELAVFLNLPDPSFCPPQGIGDFKSKNKFMTGCHNDYCLNLAFSKPGQIEVLIEDGNGNRNFDKSSEVRFVQQVTENNRAASPEDPNYPYEVCLPWSGKDGHGENVDFTDIFISGFYFQGIYHFPVYDAEFNDDGFIVETVRPALGRQELFYDDLNISSDNLAGENKDGTNGCDSPCHRWTGEYEDIPDKTQIFGNFNTINTWWFGNSTFKDFSFQVSPRPAMTCPSDYIGCVGDDISPNVIGSAMVDSQNPACTILEFKDRVLEENSVCTGDLFIERTWTVYLQGLENDKTECYQIIRLTDEIAPVLSGVPEDISIACGAIPSPPTSISATDNCNVTSALTIDFSEETLTGNCAGSFKIRRIWTATDRCGNSSSAEQLISVSDDIAPVLVGVPRDVVVLCTNLPDVPNDVRATDNCEASSDIQISFEEYVIAGNCAGNYSIERRWIAVDGCGNQSIAAQTITVIDEGAPTLSNVPADETVDCGNIPSASTRVTASDNCEESSDIIIAFGEEIIAGTCAGNYTIERTWTATDQCGNSASATQTITVEDTTPPGFQNVPIDVTVSCDAVPAVATNIEVSDNCEAVEDIQVTFSETEQVGTCGGNYTIERTWTAIDQCGNSTSATQTITVEDTTPPIFQNVPTDVTLSCDAIPAVATNIEVSDNCEAVENIALTFSETRQAGTCSGNFSIERTWTATDQCGNEQKATQLLTIMDTTAPTLVDVPNDITVNCHVIPVPSTAVKATDNCATDEGITIDFAEEKIAGDCAGNFTIQRVWTATDDCGNQSTQMQTLTVIDTVAPMLIGVPADITVTCEAVPASAIVSASDNCEAAEAISIVFEELRLDGDCAGNYLLKRTWTATDQCGNQQAITQSITVMDTTAPTLVDVPNDITVNCHAIPAPSTTVKATDNCAADEGITIDFAEEKITGDCAGNFTVKRIWTATDDCGNQSTETQTLTVIDTVAPTLIGVPVDMTVVCESVPMPANVSASDNCEATEAISIVFEEVRLDGDCAGNYLLKRTWTATDQCGNQSTETQTLTIMDTTSPTLVDVPNDITVNCDAIPAPSNAVKATDNCAGDEGITIDFAEEKIAGDCAGNFTVKRIWTATDDCGNQSTKTQILTVIDTIAPVLIGVPADMTVACESVPLPASVSVSDNCEATEDIIIIFKELRLDGNCPGNYTLKRAWTATDQCGNFTLGEQLITVEDNAVPIFTTCPKDLVVMAVNDCESAILDIKLPNVTDNCDEAVSVVSSADLNQPFPMGTTTVIFTATDACGNTSFCEFLVKVENAPQNHCPTNILTTADCDEDGQQAIITWEPPNGNECCSACPANTAINGFIFLGERGGHRYYLSKETENWTVAKHQSDALFGYLVSINDPAENAFLNQFIIDNAAYIGLSDEGSFGEYYWQNEEEVIYENLDTNDVEGSDQIAKFAQLNPDGKWGLSDGAKAARFIVEIPCVEVIQLTGPLNGSAFPVGTTTIAYLLDYDNCANPDTCSFDVTVDACEQFTNLGYCESAGIDTTCFWIEKVTVGGRAITSGANGGYGDFTASPTSLYMGYPQTLELTPSFAPGHTFNVYWKIWIDYNQDEAFDSEELIFSTATYEPIVLNFTIPNTVKLGLTRMRISMSFADIADPCASLTFGEVEDYLINIEQNGENLTVDADASTKRNSDANTTFTVIKGNFPAPIAGLTPMEVVARREASLSVFPNPAKAQLMLNIENYNLAKNKSIADESELIIFNQMGQMVYQTALKKEVTKLTAIDIAHLKSGIYFIQVKLGATKVLKQKFIKIE